LGQGSDVASEAIGQGTVLAGEQALGPIVGEEALQIGGMTVDAAGNVVFGEAMGALAGEVVGDTAMQTAASTIITDIIGEEVIGTSVGGWIGGIVGVFASAISFMFGNQTCCVLCTELNRQGYLPNRILKREYLYCRKHLTELEYIGYRIWADPIVKAMQHSKIITQLMRPIISGFAYEMAHRIDPRIKGSMLGKVLWRIGKPMCGFFGTLWLRMEVKNG
jgi:hypothetical protein